MAALPMPRAVLTSLINAISKIPLEEETPSADPDGFRHTGAKPSDKSPSNALKHVPLEHRHLIVTLHVLFPSLLLPALDLLDRDLVTRLTLEPRSQAESGKKARSGVREPGRAEQSRDGGGVQEGTGPAPHEGFFLVRSAQSTHPRRRFAKSKESAAAAAVGQTSYAVRLDAWNCTCAAFAFSAFSGVPGLSGGPALGSESKSDVGAVGQDHQEAAGDRRKGSSRRDDHGQEPLDEWSFGGMSSDGTEGSAGGSGGVPVCKHLLACLLAERWKNALGRYVVARMVRREEMAGLVADT